MADNDIICPKAPNEEIMRMLIRANEFLNHAKEHSISGTDFDVMISIHNLDNALEYILRILIKHFDVENLMGITIETCEIDVLIGHLKRFFDDHSIPALPFVQEIKLIRKQRNMVQHAITNPAPDLKIYIGQGERFFERVLNKYFGIEESELRFSTLIQDEFIRNLIKEAEQKTLEKDYIGSIVASRDAFDYAVFINPLYHSERIWNPPALVEAKRNFREIPSFLSNIYDLLTMSIMSVDMPRYNRYREYVDYIPREFCKDGKSYHVKQQPWKREDADYCYLFVCETILQWQSFNTSRVDTPTQFDHDYRFEESIEGISIGEHYESKGCFYGLSEGIARLFYVDSKEKADRIVSKAERGYLYSYFKHTVDGTLDKEYKEFIKVLAIDYKLVMNRPESWQIYLFYEPIPFTTQHLSGDTESVDIDSLNVPNIFGEKYKDRFPITEIESAIELGNALKEDNHEIECYYSSKLVGRLCEDNKDE